MATILNFPRATARCRAARDERVVAETYWAIVTQAADGSKTLATMRSPRFLSPRRAYASPEDGEHSAVRSFLMYKFSCRVRAGEPERTAEPQSGS